MTNPTTTRTNRPAIGETVAFNAGGTRKFGTVVDAYDAVGTTVVHVQTLAISCPSFDFEEVHIVTLADLARRD